MAESVLILGGGVAGMTVAHELGERGFAVTVIELRTIPGGKARSIPVDGTGADGRANLPGEHGFRFFPGFYQHIPDTMRRIPFATNPNGVFDNLRESTRAEILRAGRLPLVMPMNVPGNRADRKLWRRSIFLNGLNIRVRDWGHFVKLLVQLSASCDDRRYGQYENVSWWEFCGADQRSLGFQQFLADGLTRSLVAAKAREISARTGGYILLQLLQSFGPRRADRGVDRVLDGPTNERWIGPWREHLVSLGVTYTTGQKVKSIELEGDRVSKVIVHNPGRWGKDDEVTADWIIAALPVEVIAQLVTDEMKAIDPGLALLASMTTRWMNGIMFYLRRQIPLVHGHVIYIDAPWALTSISQAQFWEGVDFSNLGDGTVCDILSVDVSAWDVRGVIYGKNAVECTQDEIIAEVWLQMKEHLNVGESVVITDDDLVGAFVDEDVETTANPRVDINLEPLLINTSGSWAMRPTGATKITNLLLASDYVRTYTDLATMEGANEAARRAVNTLLDRTGSKHKRCKVYPLHEPLLFRPLKFIDRLLYRRRHGRPKEPVGPGRGQ